MRSRIVLVRLILGIAAALMIGVLLLAVASHEEKRMTTTAARLAGRDVENGAAIFRDACAGCHGIAGRGVPGVAPALNDPAFFTSRLRELNYQGSLRGFIETTVAGGRPVATGRSPSNTGRWNLETGYSAPMPAWSDAYGGPLRPDQIDDIASFILSWEAPARGEVAAASPVLPPPKPPPSEGAQPAEIGKTVYAAKKCLGCHGWPGSGGVTGPDLAGIAVRGPQRAPGLTAEEFLRVALLAPSASLAPDCPTPAGGSPGSPCPDMMPRDYGIKLTQQEIEVLVRYMLTLTGEPEAGLPPLPTATPRPTATAARPGSAVRAGGATADANRGRKLYEDHCSMCHGDRGQGGMGAALSIIGISVDPWRYARTSTAEGMPGTMMPAWSEAFGGPLNEGELDDVAAYVVELSRQVRRTDGSHPEGQSPNPAATPTAQRQ
jgi:mono/diheme cytochrome c family protein